MVGRCFLIFLIIFILVIGGCSNSEKLLLQDKESNSQIKYLKEQLLKEQQEDRSLSLKIEYLNTEVNTLKEVNEELISSSKQESNKHIEENKKLYTIIAILNEKNKNLKAMINSISSTNDKKTLFLYVPDDNAEYLQSIPVNIKEDANQLINQLLSYYSKILIDFNVKLIDIKIENSIAYVNLSREYNQHGKGNICDTARLLLLDSIVNTLCLNDTLNIRKVNLFSDGVSTEHIAPMLTGGPFEATPYRLKTQVGGN